MLPVLILLRAGDQARSPIVSEVIVRPLHHDQQAVLEFDDVEQMDDGDELDSEDDVEEDIDDVGEHEMKIAKVYEKTISLLGDTVGGTPIGIITED